MKNLAKIRDEHEGAFTLVELLVVILIIGILAAIAIPAFLNQRKAAVDSSVESDVKNASTQIETWAVSNPKDAIEGLTITEEDGVTKIEDDNPLSEAIDPKLIDLESIKIGEGTTLVINSTGNTGEYRILGVNPDGNRANKPVPSTADVAGGSLTKDSGILFDSTAGGMQ